MNERLWDILISSFPRLLSYGLKVTLPLTALSFVLALVISVLVAMIQYAKVPVLRQICRSYIWVVRGTPLLVQLFLVFYGLPKLGVVWAAFPTAIVVFGFNEGAYMAESVRGALESVSRGQMEAVSPGSPHPADPERFKPGDYPIPEHRIAGCPRKIHRADGWR